jgi:hypothetical protein
VESPTAERLGRVNVGRVDLKLRPDADCPTIRPVYEDTVVPLFFKCEISKCDAGSYSVELI